MSDSRRRSSRRGKKLGLGYSANDLVQVISEQNNVSTLFFYDNHHTLKRERSHVISVVSAPIK